MGPISNKRASDYGQRKQSGVSMRRLSRKIGHSMMVGRSGPSSDNQLLSVPHQGGRRGTVSKPSSSHKRSAGSLSSGGSSGGGSQNSDDNTRRRKKKGKNKNQKDNIFTKLRDSIAESDVFVEKNGKPVHQTTIDLTLAAIPPFIILLIWDQLSVTIFEVPHLSMLEHPGFMLVFQFVCIMFAMYGYCVQFVMTGSTHYVTLAKLSLTVHYILFGWRVFLELTYDGFRYQEKSFLPRDSPDLFEENDVDTEGDADPNAGTFAIHSNSKMIGICSAIIITCIFR